MCVFQGLLFQSRAALLFITALKEFRFKHRLNLAAFLRQTVLLCCDHTELILGMKPRLEFFGNYIISCNWKMTEL